MTFSGTTPVHDGSVLFTVGRRVLHISQHRLLLYVRYHSLHHSKRTQPHLPCMARRSPAGHPVSHCVAACKMTRFTVAGGSEP